MNYNNLELRIAAATGEIVLGKVKKGAMEPGKRYVTEECLRAVTEYFKVNDKISSEITSKDDETTHAIFYTSDPDKIKEITAILEEKDSKK